MLVNLELMNWERSQFDAQSLIMGGNPYSISLENTFLKPYQKKTTPLGKEGLRLVKLK